MDYATAEYALAAAMLVTSMYGMGTTLTAKDFLDVIRSPVSLAIIMAMQWLATPLLAVVLARVLQVSPGVAAGMLLMVALPGGSYTNLFTYLGRGNVALSVAATTLCTSLCLVTTPLVLQLFGHGLNVAGVVMPAELIVTEIGYWLLGPLAAGMATRRFLPLAYASAGRWSIRASLAVMAVLFATLIAAGRLELLSQSWRGPLAVLLLTAASLWLTYGVCLLARRSCPDILAIGIEVVVRNGNLALLLQASLFAHAGPIAASAQVTPAQVTIGQLTTPKTEPAGATPVGATPASSATASIPPAKDSAVANATAAAAAAATSQAATSQAASDMASRARAAGALYAILMYVCVSLGIAGIEVVAHRQASGVIYRRAAGVRTVV